MNNVSEIVVIGLLEALAVLAIAIIVLLVFNHRLHKKGHSLNTQLTQVKETTRFLLEKVNAFHTPSYSHYLEKAISEAQQELEAVYGRADQEMLQTKTEEENAAILHLICMSSELAAEQESDVEARNKARTNKLRELVSHLQEPTPATVAKDEVEDDLPQESGLDEVDLKQKWGYLCDAAVNLVTHRTRQSADDLIDIVKVINSDLGLRDIVVPNADQPAPATNSNEKLRSVKKDAQLNKEIISKLLAERNAAEAEVTIKSTELEQLQRYLNESNSCLTQLEEELDLLKLENDTLKDSSDSNKDAEEMSNLIQRFTQESKDMLMCIETLEQENTGLKNQLGQEQ